LTRDGTFGLARGLMARNGDYSKLVKKVLDFSFKICYNIYYSKLRSI